MNLTALQHSPFLQSLGWAIANSLWQAASLWVAYYLINETYKNTSARFKTNTAIIMLSSSFAWFCFTLFSKYFSLQDKLIVDAVTQYYAPTKSSNIFSIVPWPLILNKLAAALPYLSLAYLLLLVFLSFRLISCYRYTNFIKTQGLQKPSEEWKLFTERVALHIGITKKIKLWVSHHIDVPATIGFIKPVILIPVASINRLSAEQLEAIILHELSHIKRNDYLINIFISLVETILFFNPFIVLLAKIIKRERENCCDDFVIQYQYDRHSYASALLSLEQYRNVTLSLAISATSGKKQLLHRVKRIMEAKNSSTFNYGQKLLALLLITGIFSSVAWLSPNNENKKQNIKSDKVALKDLNVLKKIGTLLSQQNNSKLKDVVASLQSSITDKEIKQLAVIQKKIKNKEIIIKPVLQEKDETSDQDIVLQNITIKAPKVETLFAPSEVRENRKNSSSNTQFYSKAATAAGVEKLQFSKLLPTEFKSLYDLDCMEADIKQLMLNTYKYLPADEHFNILKREQLQKLINKEINNSRVRTYSRTQVPPVLVRTFSSKTKPLADSVLSKKMVFINNRVRRTLPRIAVADRELITMAEGSQYSPSTNTIGAYGFTTSIHISAPNNNPGNCGGGSGVGSNAPTLYVNSKVSPQLKSRTIIIDGKEIKLPETDKIIAQLKGKKFSVVTGNEVIEIQFKD